MTRTIDTRRARRAGMTLIEMLVVLAILVILVALSAAAAVRVMGSQYTANTRTAITRANSRLQQQIAYIIDQARGETIPTGSPFPSPPNDPYSLSATTVGGASNANRARVIHMKFRMQQYFPTTFNEALSPASGYPPIPGYVSFLAQYNISSGNTPALPEESAVCLYMILRYGPNTTVDADLGLGSSSTKNLSKVANAPGLVDAWGNPLVFCRWPVGTSGTFVSPVNPSGPKLFSATNGLSQDPLDPKGWLTGNTSANSWLNGVPAATFQARCHPLPPRVGNKPQSINLTPVIVSSGQDAKLGLSFDPNDPMFPGCPFTETNPGNNSTANDNIYSTYIN